MRVCVCVSVCVCVRACILGLFGRGGPFKGPGDVLLSRCYGLYGGSVG